MLKVVFFITKSTIDSENCTTSSVNCTVSSRLCFHHCSAERDLNSTPSVWLYMNSAALCNAWQMNRQKETASSYCPHWHIQSVSNNTDNKAALSVDESSADTYFPRAVARLVEGRKNCIFYRRNKQENVSPTLVKHTNITMNDEWISDGVTILTHNNGNIKSNWRSSELGDRSGGSHLHKILLEHSWQVCVTTRASSGTVEKEGRHTHAEARLSAQPFHPAQTTSFFSMNTE